MPDLLERWTREDVLALPDDGNRYELVDGELLVSPSPRLLHQAAVSAMNDRVKPYVTTHRLGLVLFSPADLDLRSGQLVQPDLFVIAHTPDAGPKDWPDIGVPILTVEVLSPSTARYDRLVKRRLYQRVGVAEYWIVDLDARVVERWRPEDERPEVLAEELVWTPDVIASAEGAKQPLRIDLPSLFREIHGTSGT